MKILDVKKLKTARKYSNALIESAVEAGIADKISDDLNIVIETLKENEQLSKFLLNPVIKVSDKKEILQKIFSSYTNKITTDFLNLLADNNRLDILNEVLECYNTEFNKKYNICTPVIISAVELSEEQKIRIVEKISNKLLKKVNPQYIINPDIIGGLTIEISDKTIDCSLKTKFENMRKQLIKGNRYGSY